MRRRDFLATLPCAAAAQTAAPGMSLNAFAEMCSWTFVRGYVANLAKTSDSYAVVEYPGATITKNFLAKSGPKCHRCFSHAARDCGVDCC